MRVLILSDTHIPHRSRVLPDAILEELAKVDAVIHCGDFTSYTFYEELKILKSPLYAVKGNMDDEDLYDMLPETLVFQLEGVKIGLYHGIGAPWGLENKVIEKFIDHPDINLICFGHSHRPLNQKHGNIILFNPGSPTDTIFAPRKSYGILEIEEGLIKKLEHVFL
ncbi:MAG: metallophosphoesterase [candidate division WOR-3 bacterium]